MPRIFKIGGYLVYFWSNENSPLEPVHVYVSKGIPSEGTTKTEQEDVQSGLNGARAALIAITVVGAFFVGGK